MSFDFRYRRHAEALYEALRDDAFYRTLEESVEESSREAMLRYMDYSMAEGQLYGELCLLEDEEYGASVWTTPLDKERATDRSVRKKDFIAEHMGRRSLATYNGITSCMAEQAEPVVGPDWWYLSILGISPGLQGQGRGAHLVAHVLKITDRLQVPTYLETFSPRNISFYNRMGYEVVDSFHESTIGAPYWLMVRDAHNGTGTGS